jgi:3-oxoacyl-[acyl-carrier protein] reductase
VKGKAVVLGASREGGTGWAIAEALGRAGMHVCVGARRHAGITRLASRIGGEAVVCDATVEDSVAAMAAAAVRAGPGPLDTAILAAGEGVLGSIDGITQAELERAVSLNFMAPVYFIRHMVRCMRDGGSIVLMSSIAATHPWPGYFSYGSAKAAVHSLVKYAALEYASRGIRINAVCPGPIQKPAVSPTPASSHSALIREIPLGRSVITTEVAEAVVWFALAARWITGEILHVDGGMHLRRPPFPDELAQA